MRELESNLSERNQSVLKALVQRFISEGQPVASKALSESSDIHLSSASIRNVMADLERYGLIASPHTSAGRVPTVQGYRFFVDSLLTVQPLEACTLLDMQGQFNGDMNTGQLVASTSALLSQMTSQAGLVTVPKREEVTLRHVEFLPLSDNRVLAILVGNEQEVQNRVLHMSEQLDEPELKQAANYINHHFSGLPLSRVRDGLLGAMRADKDKLSGLMQQTIDMAAQVFDNPEADYVLAGESHLIDSNPNTDIDSLKELLKAFEQKKDVLNLLERCLAADGTQIFIGEESGYTIFDDFSVVTSPYQIAGDTVGVIGVVGPTRMAYDRIIPMVDVTAKLLSAALERG